MSISRRHLQGPQPEFDEASVQILGCLALDDPASGRKVAQVYFAPAFLPDQLDTSAAHGLISTHSIGGGLVATYVWPGDGPVTVALGDAPALEITPMVAETALFEGLNCAIVERNGETLDSVCDWLAWHQKQHGLQGALIIDRGHPDRSEAFATSLRKSLNNKVKRDMTIVVLSSSAPLGKPGLGPESHPINAPDAPGKDRMSQDRKSVV